MARCAGGVCSVAGNNQAIAGNSNVSPVQLQSAGEGRGQYAQFPLYTQQQENTINLLNQLAQGRLRNPNLGLGPSPLQNPANNWQQYFNFAPIEQQARTQFQTQTIPSLAERFTAMGGEGGQRSSAFQAALGRAGSDLEQGLAALKAQYALPQAQLAQNQQQIGLSEQGMRLNLLQTLLSGGLNRQFEGSYFRRQPQGFWENFLDRWNGAYSR